jgi:hypothetical protein
MFIFSFPEIGSPITAGIDPSYQFALNYFFSHNIQIGKDIIYTYGPLGFLLFPKPIGNNVVISVVIIPLLKLAFLMSFLFLNFMIKKPNTLTDKIGMSVIFVIISFLTDLGLLLVFLPASLLLLYGETKKRIFVVLAVVITSTSILVKSSLGIVNILLLLSYQTIDTLQFKNIKLFLYVLLGLALAFLLEWFVIYQDFSGIANYLWGTWELSSGNSSAMTINPEDSWILLSIFFLLCFSLPFYIKEKRIFILYGMFFLPLFAFFKYAFGREDHIHFFLFYMICFYCLALACLRRFKVRVFLIVLISLSAFMANTIYVKGSMRPIRAKRYAINGLFYFEREVLNLQDYETFLLETSRVQLRSKVLNKNVLRVIGKNSVDVYPYETTYIHANSLNWQPRPVIQSYVAYTPWLDKRNAMFFDSPRSPQFIIWDTGNFLGETSSIDGRYVLNDEPVTVYEIFRHYKLIYRDKVVAIFEKSSADGLKEPKVIGSERSHWDEWVRVPSVENGIIRAKIDISRKFMGSLKRLMYKEEEFFIEYKLESGEIKKYRLVIDNGVSGVWITPLIVRLSNPFGGVRVQQIRLSHSRHDFLKEEINIGWELIEPLGDSPFSLNTCVSPIG